MCSSDLLSADAFGVDRVALPQKGVNGAWELSRIISQASYDVFAREYEGNYSLHAKPLHAAAYVNRLNLTSPHGRCRVMKTALTAATLTVSLERAAKFPIYALLHKPKALQTHARAV